MLQAAIRRRGHCCETATDGESALHLISQSQYDVVITDLVMPRQHGHRLCVNLLATPDRPALIVLTGVMEPRLEIDLRARGIDELFYKPMSTNELVRRIEDLACRRSLARQKKWPAGHVSLPWSRSSASEDVRVRVMHRESDLRHDAVDHSVSPIRPLVELPEGRKHVVLVLLNNSDESEQLARVMSSSTISAVSCSSADHLLKRLKEERADILVIEQELSGFLSGIEILERLQKDLIPIESILLAPAARDLQRRVEEISVHAVLDPKCSDGEIRDSVQALIRHLAADVSFIPHAARHFVRQCDSVPPLPQLLVKLLGFMQMELSQIPLDALCQDIAMDPRSSVDLLRFTNSSSLGLRNEVRKIPDAVSLLGPKRAISLIFSSVVTAVRFSNIPEDIRHWYYRRSVLTASVAATFGKRLERISEDLAFTMGMLQDIGILLLAGRISRYSALVERFRTTATADLMTMEQEDYGMTHASVGAGLLNEWQLPNSFVRPVLEHHQPRDPAVKEHTRTALDRLMKIGEAFADLCDVPHPRRRDRLNRLLAHYGTDKSSTCQSSLKEAVARAHEASQLLSLPTPDTETLRQLVAEALDTRAPVATFDDTLHVGERRLVRT